MIKSSSKRANIWGLCEICLCSPSSRTLYKLALEPQVPFASLSSPAVMDIRRLRRRLLEKIIDRKCVYYALAKVQILISAPVVFFKDNRDNRDNSLIVFFLRFSFTSKLKIVSIVSIVFKTSASGPNKKKFCFKKTSLAKKNIVFTARVRKK